MPHNLKSVFFEGWVKRLKRADVRSAPRPHSQINVAGGSGGEQGAMGCGASKTTAVDPLGQDISLSQLEPAPGAVSPPSIRLQSVGQSRVRALWGLESRGGRKDGGASPPGARFSAEKPVARFSESADANPEREQGTSLSGFNGGADEEEADAPVFMLEVDAGTGKGFERVYVGADNQV